MFLLLRCVSFNNSLRWQLLLFLKNIKAICNFVSNFVLPPVKENVPYINKSAKKDETKSLTILLNSLFSNLLNELLGENVLLWTAANMHKRIIGVAISQRKKERKTQTIHYCL